MHRTYFLTLGPKAHRSLGAGLISLLLLFCIPAWTQSGLHPTAAPASQPAPPPQVPKDPLGRTTPRGTAFGFLTAARKGDNEVAALYLNTRLRGQAASNLAHQFYVVLDRRLPARLIRLSDQPEGSLSDPLRPNEELIGTIESHKGDVDIVIERIDRGKSGLLWLISSKTLESIPELYAEADETSVENVLPGFLVNTRIAGIVLFEWLAVLVGMPLFWFLAVLLGHALSRLGGRWRRELYRNPGLPNPHVLPKPLIPLLLALVIHWLLTKLGLPLLARQFWLSTASILTIVGCVWLLILLNGRAESYLSRSLQARKITGGISVMRLARRGVDLLIIFAGLLVTLRIFAVNPAPALAGLGVGGIAVALAAQRTLENVIAGISLVSDRAVNVGDFLKVGEISGTVLDVGLRSTRIRTLSRSIITFPNSQVANASVETFSARDKYWFHPILSLRYDTTAAQMQAFLESIRTLMSNSRHVEPDSIRVRLLGFGASSLDVEVFTYFLANDWNQFLEIQEILVLQIMNCMEATGVHLALPSQRIFTADASEATEARAERLLKAPAPANEIRGQEAAKSA
jgi:MscS family membrane protein